MALGVAVLGAGRIGRVHAGAISESDNGHLVAVADIVPRSAEALAVDHDCTALTVNEIADRDDIHAVVICTPTDTHADLVEMFAPTGKAILCEKPVDLDLARVRRCLSVVEANRAILMVGFNRRFDPHFAALKAAVDDGQAGDVEVVTIVSRDPAPPPPGYIQSSGGFIRDMTIHDFDTSRWLLAEQIEWVQATASNLVDPQIGELGDFDTASVILTTVSGRQGIINNSRRATYGYDQRIEVFGSKGAVWAENTHLSNTVIANNDGFHRPPILDWFMTRYTAAFRAEIDAFLDAVRKGQPPPTTGDDGLQALILAEAALLSIAEKRAVNVSEIATGAAL